MTRWYVYLLRCRDGSLYTGATNNLLRRVYEHKRGLVPGFTPFAPRVPSASAVIFLHRPLGDEAPDIGP